MPTLDRPSDTAGHLGALLADLRPLGARSVIASTLLGVDRGELAVERLVLAGELFGIGEGAIRTALWRMVSAGELTARDGSYRLAGRLLGRRQRSGASAAARRPSWDGTWELVIVTPDRRSADDRRELRSAAAALHLAEVREGVWGRPDNLDPGRAPEHRAVVNRQCTTFRGAVGPRDLAARLFDLDTWAARAGTLIEAIAAAPWPRDELRPGDLADGFRLSIAVVRHLDRDPLLPDQLLPARWPGSTLRDRYQEYHQWYEHRFATWVRI